MTAATRPHTAAATDSPAPPWGALAILMVGQGMAAMDTSIVNVAAPSIRASLRTSAPTLQLAISSYLVIYAALLITGSRLGRDHGPARVFRGGLVLFTASSLACGLSGGTAVLVLARACQGAGAALMVPQVLALIGVSFAGVARARAVSLYSFVLGAGVALGQVLGGVLVNADIGGLRWRPVFLVNIPVGAVLIVLAWRCLPRDAVSERARFDVLGLALLTPALLAVLVPLAFGPQEHWPTWTVALLVAGCALLIAFVFVERGSEKRGGAPLIPPALLREPGVRRGLTVVFLVFAGYGGLLFTVALYLQGPLRYSALRSGLAFALYAVGFGTVNMLWSRLPIESHRFVPVAGLSVLFLADAGLALSLGRPAWGLTQALLLLVAGIGHGAGFGSTVSQVVRRAGPAHASAASGVVTTATQLSIAAGVAILGSVYLATSGHGATPMQFVCACLAGASLLGLLLALSLVRLEA